ncbi:MULTISPECIES: sugar ABC transporter substrate-binding protein [unclassified Caballeronia]|uniref:sugar ABC transporter substrate-binding protein n=1 Tax=unclassified Caballeronia TaxID=2646786 RepID=UPI002856059A|nr:MULTISPECIES: sugar ABC transporter substrate-binding protein [unclassified Caballeronia]MDR5753249.1 sugar ABC transporter substrate-binding protein [Caballeronia sp. LZ024]MDR5840988.1 sugar ABC transporter substrate-binding protein [Caballeronia sp. LZ031]
MKALTHTIRHAGRLALGAAFLGALALSGPASAADKYKIFLSMSYVGNDWQTEAANMVKAMAGTPALKDKVDLEVQVAGTDAQKQIQQINSMVQAGAKAIVIYPISPTALNRAIKNACSKGVVVAAYDGEVTEPCAHNVTIDQHQAGTVTAEWLAKTINGKGNIVMINGVPGTSVDRARTEAAKAVFAKFPGIKVVAEGTGMWSQATAKTELSKILATNSWDKIDGLWMQVGCFTAASMQLEAGVADDKVKPCAGESSNGHRVQMLPPGTVKGEGAYRSIGYRSISYGAPPYSGAMALKMAVQKLDGKDFPQRVTLKLPLVETPQSKLCKTGSIDELKAGCTAFMPDKVPPGWFADIYSDDTREVGFNAALTGKQD